MKCQKCTQPAVVHLTELLSEGAVKKAVEVHLCYDHAIEAGLIAPGAPAQIPPASVALQGSKKAKHEPETAIVPAPPPGAMAIVRKEGEAGAGGCPVCGATWSQFKNAGVMGCPHDYAHFESKVLPLVKRAQEGAVQHTGKVPSKIQHTEMTREVTATRLKRELQKAIRSERYEEAARLRDQLSKIAT